MAKDEFKNLGFSEDKPAAEPKKEREEKGEKGELRWQRLHHNQLHIVAPNKRLFGHSGVLGEEEKDSKGSQERKP